jgi:putative peptidoglycan lipid II flippase
MAEGTVRAYQQATTLHMVPINLIGVAISNAAFPRMSERLGQNRPDLFRKELQSILRIIIWLALPVATISYFTRGSLVNFIKNGGNSLIAGILGALVIAILFRSIYHIAARTFYAQQDTKTPLYVSLFCVGLNIALAVWFTTKLDMGAYGLAWAQSIVAAIEVFILFIIMARRIENLFDMVFVHAIARMASATGFMAIISYLSVLMLQLAATDQSFLATFPKFVTIVAVSLTSYVIFCRLLALEEANPVITFVRRLFFGKNRT